MSVLASVKVKFVYLVLAAGEYDGDTQAVGESSFIVNTTSCALFAVREVRYEKSGPL